MLIAEYDTTETWSGLEAPRGWHVTDVIHSHEDGSVCGFAWQRLTGQAIMVMEDVTIKADGKRWLHVSVAKPNNKMPTYTDLQEARILFLGEDRESYSVYPPKERYVNFTNTLHLWCNLDQPDGVLPHFDGVVELNGQKVRSI